MDDAIVAAFYARVVSRVCAGFRERDPTGNADVAALLEQVCVRCRHDLVATNEVDETPRLTALCLVVWT